MTTTVNQIEFTKEPCAALVGARQNLMALSDDNYVLFCTISPNPKIKITCSATKGNSVKSVQVSYDKAPQVAQMNYCIKYFKNVYLSNCSNPVFVGCFEHNKSGNVHMHFLLHDDEIKNKYYLDIFRRDIACNSMTVANRTGKNDYMNNIVQATDPIVDILKYMDKEYNDAVLHGPYHTYCSKELTVPKI